LSANVKVTHTYRFRSTSSSAEVITETNLIGIVGMVGTVANTSTSLIANAVKVHRISVWAPPASQGATATCSINWSSREYAQSVEVSDTTMSVAEPAHITARPPVGSAADFWLSPGGNTILTLIAPVGSIIDVHCTHVLQDTATAGVTYTAAAAALGVMYYPPLDGESDLYLPVSLGTTT
jgi:hypothetical protein